MKKIQNYHRIAIISLLLFGTTLVWGWGSMLVLAASADTQVSVEVSSDTDVCLNIPGVQASVPAGLTSDGNGNCTTPPTDLCDNLPGTQTDLPDGYYRDGTSCYQQTTPPTDVCNNIDGIQTSVPDGYTLNSDGSCVKDQPDQCSNIDGVQTSVPSPLLRDSTGSCYTPAAGVQPTDSTPPQGAAPLPDNSLDTLFVNRPTPSTTPSGDASKKADIKNIPDVLDAAVAPIISMIPASLVGALRTLPPVFALTYGYAVLTIAGVGILSILRSPSLIMTGVTAANGTPEVVLHPALVWLPIGSSGIALVLGNFFLGTVGNVEIGSYNLALQTTSYLVLSTVHYAVANSHFALHHGTIQHLLHKSAIRIIHKL